MSDAAIATIAAAAVTITTMVIGFLSLWVKLKYGVQQVKEASDKAEEAARAASEKAKTVEEKLDANTNTTKSVDAKTDTIVKQTNGAMMRLTSLVEDTVLRVSKLEEYNRQSNHRLADAVNALHLKVAEILALQPKPISQPNTQVVQGNTK